MRYVFGDSMLDTQLYVLHRGDRSLPLRAKVFQVLHYLLTHRDRVISKQEICEQVWSNQSISEAALEGVIKAVRQAVGDDGRTQWCVQTRRGQGYRFVASVTMAAPAADASVPHALAFPAHSGAMVGREEELAELQCWWRQARQGTRQVGFVTGEAGIGKTTLVDALVAGATRDTAVWVGRGQCIEQYGAGEAYLPLLEALGRLCRGPDGASLLALLLQHAPSWLVQMPALLSAAEYKALQRLAPGVTRARMLRELAEAVEALTVERPLILVLEDLHWGDVSTYEWLAYVARRRDPARLLVLGTYRHDEALRRTHPLRAVMPELQRQQPCHVMDLAYLSPTAVAAYVAQRFEGKALPQELPRIIHQRTDGNPLFMVSLVDDMVQQGVLYEGPDGWEIIGDGEAETVGVPENLRHLIDQQLERLEPDDQRLLEAASVAGTECSAAVIAAAIDREVGEVEERCTSFARQHRLLRACGTEVWPDGTVAARYRFRHALYQDAVYARVPPGQRVRMHRQIGDRLETGYGSQSGDMAAELAMHFARGRDLWRAVRYQHTAGENALRRSAHQEATHHLTQGLALLATLPDSHQRAQQELTLHLALGRVLTVTRGYAAPEVGSAYTTARVLAQQVGDPAQRFSGLFGLWQFHILRTELQTAYAMARQLFQLAHRQGDALLLLQAHRALGYTLLCRGEVVRARWHAEQGAALYEPAQHHQHAFQQGQDARITCLVYAAQALWMLGYPTQAGHKSTEALTLAQGLQHPYSLTFTLGWAAWLHQHRREWQVVQARAETVVELASEHGFALWVAQGTIMRGWALVMEGQAMEGMAQLRQGLAALESTGTALMRPYFLALMAEASGKTGQYAEGRKLLKEAQDVARRHGERFCEVELYRLEGELLLAGTRTPRAAERCFQRAMACARSQRAKALELRAAMSLARLWWQQGKREAALQVLTPVYEWFTEGFDTVDLQEAKALLEA